MPQKLHSSLPYVLVNYIFFLAKILYIQSIWRKNRPRKICYCNPNTLVNNLLLGNRVLLIWRLSPITKIPYRKVYGTIDKIGQNTQTYICRVRLLSSSSQIKRVYYYYDNQNSCIWAPDKLIVLEDWKTINFV